MHVWSFMINYRTELVVLWSNHEQVFFTGPCYQCWIFTSLSPQHISQVIPLSSSFLIHGLLSFHDSRKRRLRVSSYFFFLSTCGNGSTFLLTPGFASVWNCIGHAAILSKCQWGCVILHHELFYIWFTLPFCISHDTSWRDSNSGTTHDKNEKWMFPSDCKRYPDYETDTKFRKIENNRMAYLSDIPTDRETEFIGHLDFLSAKPTKPTLFNNSVMSYYW